MAEINTPQGLVIGLVVTQEAEKEPETGKKRAPRKAAEK